ncbi:pyruvate dehydrogenase complex dihydrolipoamide acetyltransferase [Segnochrobactrum spirostomi]|uniref:Acetyltransferase component of pyruvate dehydrogenase complex n=1 Tax=Segnochrobactrum spirostomi TaxID=2608987 RepID=A0A6A7Y5V6_9HYPH|nr:pyruvate dehydrogenase complex dihydrolipoamide acetyltransferase [Segnochrobactrum spirostomi]MQT14594.1 pyruvate dehydrogenase complex dihydrolipoamide acetyltransferase [Segnochrobactrum spirostomi]
MPIDILMPALSPTMEKGNLAKWLVKKGDQVKSGDVIAEIETDKATMEVEAVDEGIVGDILVPEGTPDVAVNARIAVLLGEGEDASALAAPAKTAPAAVPSAVATAETPAPAPAKADDAGAQPRAGLNGGAAANGHGERLFASPLARRLAKEQGLDLGAIKGSGPHGRIVKSDIEAAAGAGTAKAAPAPAATASASAPAAAPVALPTGLSDEAVLKLFEPGSYDVVPHDGMRKVIARRLLESKLTIPHFYLSLDVELDALLKLRADINDAAPVVDGKPAYKVSVNDFVIKALAAALKAVPDANVTWTEGGMLKHKVVDIGVAVSLPGGLITPVVRNADRKTISAISNEMKDLAARARAKKLKPEEYQGGSTAVSNLGMYGVKDFAAIVNPPHATILAVGAGEQRPVVRGGQLAVATVMTITLSTDHRAVDGALGAELGAAFKAAIEKPLGLLV